jgi:putative heme transporter
VATWALASGGVVASAALALLGLLGSMLAGGRGGPISLAVEGALLLVLCGGVRKLQRRPESLLGAARWVLIRVNAVRRRAPTAGADTLEALVTQLRSVRPRGRDWAVAGAFAVANWLFDVGCLAAAAMALGVQGLTLPLLLVAYTAGMAAQSLSLLPGGLGVVDAALVLSLVAGGIPAAVALPAVLLYRLISMVGIVAAGWAVAAVLTSSPPVSGREADALLPAA